MASFKNSRGASANRQFIKTAMNTPLLEQAHELDLARRWREEQDEEALHELTEAYLRLVIAIAARFKNYGLPLGDLIQEGNVGLMQAAARFEPERELRFSTYATWWIRATIQDYILRNWSIVRTGTTRAQKSLFFNLRRLRATLNDNPDAELTPETKDKIAGELKVKAWEVEHMVNRLSAADRSLNAPMAEDASSQWQDVLPDERDLPDEIVANEMDRDAHKALIEDALRELTDREAEIIRQRKLAEEATTLEDLGSQLGISKERVRQIEGIALKKIRTFLEEAIGDPRDAGLLPG